MDYTLIRDSDSQEADFVSLDPENPNIASPVVEVMNRPNVEGSSFRLLANKGAPYRWRGFRNFKNIYSARQAIWTLRKEIIGQLVTIDLNGQEYERLMVLDVREIASRAIVLGIGGLTTVTSGLWGDWVGDADIPAIAVVEIVVVHAGPEAD